MSGNRRGWAGGGGGGGGGDEDAKNTEHSHGVQNDNVPRYHGYGRVFAEHVKWFVAAKATLGVRTHGGGDGG